MWTDVNVIKFEDCVESYGKDFGVDRIQPGMFCASVRLFITSKAKKSIIIKNKSSFFEHYLYLNKSQNLTHFLKMKKIC